jgi:hypothetical protein
MAATMARISTPTALSGPARLAVRPSTGPATNSSSSRRVCGRSTIRLRDDRLRPARILGSVDLPDPYPPTTAVTPARSGHPLGTGVDVHGVAP